jgi:hypothetical protein
MDELKKVRILGKLRDAERELQSASANAEKNDAKQLLSIYTSVTQALKAVKRAEEELESVPVEQ